MPLTWFVKAAKRSIFLKQTKNHLVFCCWQKGYCLMSADISGNHHTWKGKILRHRFSVFGRGEEFFINSYPISFSYHRFIQINAQRNSMQNTSFFIWCKMIFSSWKTFTHAHKPIGFFETQICSTYLSFLKSNCGWSYFRLHKSWYLFLVLLP